MATRSNRAKTQEIRDFITANVGEHSADLTNRVAEKFQISRQAAHRHVNQLVKERVLTIKGTTSNRSYFLATIKKESITLSIRPNSSESSVWRKSISPLFEGILPNVRAICEHGFHEMLNNAFEHSRGTKAKIKVEIGPSKIELIISDNGVGIFKKITAELKLDDEREAILELAKGKLTTDPKKHSGEGIFFTSRIFDKFEIDSGNLSFIHSEPHNDQLLETDMEIVGTRVSMVISPTSTRTTQEVFNQYTTSDGTYDFSRTVIPIKLMRFGNENLVSRSQAKRLLVRFEKFKEIDLDFASVDMIGQAFADEIFRVFAREHPDIHLPTSNTNKQIDGMISRAKNNNV